MRSILKKIAMRKNYKENISMEAGVDPRNFRTAAELLTNSAIIYYGCLAQSHSDYIPPSGTTQRTFQTVSRSRTLLLNGQSRTWQRCEYPLYGHALLDQRMLAPIRDLLAGVQRTHNGRYTHTHSKLGLCLGWKGQ